MFKGTSLRTVDLALIKGKIHVISVQRIALLRAIAIDAGTVDDLDYHYGRVLLMRATPGDPVDALLGPRAPIEAKEALRSQLGLDKSLFLQYLDYLGHLLRFDLGSSIASQGQTVWQIIGDHFPATVELTICGLAVAAIVGITVGSVAASRPNTPIDAGGRLFGILTYATPMYWFGMLLQLVFAVQLFWFPIGTRFPLFQSLFQWKPFRTVIYPIYQIITYNRRIIAGSRPKDTGIDCAPDFHAFYRGLYIALALCLTFWMALSFPPFLQLSLGILTFLSLLPLLFLYNRWDFAGQMATVWLTTVALVVLPLVLLPSSLFVTGAAVTLGSIWFVRECRRRTLM